MRADTGAVDRVTVQKDDLMLHVIGDEKPRGICGSGIVELLAGMFLNGWVDALGNLNPDASSRIIRVKNHLDEEREEAAVCYAWAAESKRRRIWYYPDRYS